MAAEREDSVMHALASMGLPVTCKKEGVASKLLIPVKTSEYDRVLGELLEALKRSGLKLRGVVIREPTLEDVFVKLVSER